MCLKVEKLNYKTYISYVVKFKYVALKSMTCKILFRYTQYSWSRVKLLLGILSV